MDGDIDFRLEPTEIRPDSEVRGTVTVSYPGRYDGVVINTQILGSNRHITYRSYNGKTVSQRNTSRLFVGRDAMPEDRVEFVALIGFEPKEGEEHEVKFRASIIEQHKEIESRVIFARYGRAPA